ncbi:hypothetical protein L4Z68_001413 [Pseudomonas aeruginosa]|nr:hypothetical protein [Pseudomonas aeruginosa]EKX2969420.1 hypothetical protein [Pseudomonas aeruginosa]HBO8004211.1 hypothetical protein [Pseudomonas aeruginosa]
MSKLLCLPILVVAGTLLSGCATAPREGGDDKIHFKVAESSIVAVANAKPVDLPAELSDTDRARYLHGYPTVEQFPLGNLPIAAFERTDERFLKKYLVTGPDKTPFSRFNADTGIAVGSSVGGAAGGALGLLSMIGPSDAQLDFRQGMSSALCYLPIAEAKSADDAIEKCALAVRGHFKSALSNSVEVNNPGTNFLIKGDINVSGETKKAYLFVFKGGAYYAKGYAPTNIGGYEAHIAYIAVGNFTPNPDNLVTVEDVVQAIKVGKPSNMAFLFSPGMDGRKRIGVNQIGVY